MLRICKEVRIFPLCDLDSNASQLTNDVIGHFSKAYDVQIRQTGYEYQKNANKLLVIRRK